MAPERRPTLPQTIGRYKIVGRLGKGAMGVVYSAVDEIMERPVAIKVMMADLEEDPETSARFYREARAAGQLAHRNVITIYDMGEDGGRPFIVMELVEGHQLADYLKRPETAALEIKVDLMMQICEGLRAAHANGIFHRDVKPGNLVVRADGALKILDFGIARLASSNMTASGLIVGTPDYMAPEQARGQEVDQRSDIFSAGAVFYFILTGRKPFAASDLRAVLNKVERDDPLPIRDTEAPEALSRIVMKALSKAPADRHQSCGELVADLTQFRRVFDVETRQMAEDARQKLAAIDALVVERRGLAMRVTPDATTSGDDEIRQELLQRAPAFSAWLSGTIVVEPFRRGAMVELQSEMVRAHQALAAEVAGLRTADAALAAGTRAVEAGDVPSALAAFEKALQAVPGCHRARAEADKCRRVLEDLHAKREEARALVAEAKKSADLAQWATVVALCEKALALDRNTADASTLRTQAAKALDVEVRERRRAEQTAAEREEALKHAKAAEAALENSEPERALDLSKKALTTDPGLTLARRIHGQASARISAIAEAKARAASAVERLRDAKLLLAKGKYRKAREMVAAAVALDPKNVEAEGTLAAIDAEEARVVAERERARLAEDRARAIAPMLETARAAEAGRDFVRAAWTAENIMAIDLECAEARAILKRARDTIAAQPALADETVDALSGQRDASDPEGTVTLTRISPWRKLLDALRSIAAGSRRRSTAPPAAAKPVTRADRSGKGV